MELTLQLPYEPTVPGVECLQILRHLGLLTEHGVVQPGQISLSLATLPTNSLVEITRLGGNFDRLLTQLIVVLHGGSQSIQTHYVQHVVHNHFLPHVACTTQWLSI